MADRNSIARRPTSDEFHRPSSQGKVALGFSEIDLHSAEF